MAISIRYADGSYQVVNGGKTVALDPAADATVRIVDTILDHDAFTGLAPLYDTDLDSDPYKNGLPKDALTVDINALSWIAWKIRNGEAVVPEGKRAALSFTYVRLYDRREVTISDVWIVDGSEDGSSFLVAIREDGYIGYRRCRFDGIRSDITVKIMDDEDPAVEGNDLDNVDPFHDDHKRGVLSKIFG
jgi:hypothetical protein